MFHYFQDHYEFSDSKITCLLVDFILLKSVHTSGLFFFSLLCYWGWNLDPCACGASALPSGVPEPLFVCTSPMPSSFSRREWEEKILNDKMGYRKGNNSGLAGTEYIILPHYFTIQRREFQNFPAYPRVFSFFFNKKNVRANSRNQIFTVSMNWKPP